MYFEATTPWTFIASLFFSSKTNIAIIVKTNDSISAFLAQFSLLFLL